MSRKVRFQVKAEANNTNVANKPMDLANERSNGLQRRTEVFWIWKQQQNKSKSNKLYVRPKARDQR